MSPGYPGPRPRAGRAARPVDCVAKNARTSSSPVVVLHLGLPAYWWMVGEKKQPVPEVSAHA